MRPQCYSLTGPSHGLPKRPSGLASSTIRQPFSTARDIPYYTYRVAASFSGKGRRFNPKADTYSYPHDQELFEGPFTGRPSSGQDAFFVSRVGNSNITAFGVADGVGGWSDSGFDSAHFSHGLCHLMALSAESTTGEVERKRLGPRELLTKAYKGIVTGRKIEGGGSTACVAVGREDGNLTVANLGDSGFVQLRLNAVHHYSNPQTHAFNTPYQLSIIPPRVLALSRLFGGGPLSDLPKDASGTTHQVRHGDILVFATDGVWDNLSPVDLLRLVSRQMAGLQAWVNGDNGTEVSDKIHELTREGGVAKGVENSLQTVIAANIVGEAKAASVNMRRNGPFAREVQKHYPHEDWHGGKVDDICAVVAVVVQTKRDSP
ncbi:MAG: hypothetical protein Q9163_003090 [Psora crenata]